VRLTSSERVDELRVPVRAIVDPSGDRPFVWQIDADGVARRVDVRLGALRDVAASATNEALGDDADRAGPRGDAEVTLLEPSPLAERARVIVAGHRSVLDGDHVDVADRPAAPASPDARTTDDVRRAAGASSSAAEVAR
jgi:hypothetical protein